MSRSRSSRLVVAGALSVVLGSALLTGCGSSDDGGSDPSAGLTGDPITIGYVNTEGKGALSSPTYTEGVDRAVERVNEDGGIDGRPVVVKKCLTDGSPASSIACANGFVESGVVMVLNGLDAGFDAAAPVLVGARIPAFAALFPGPVAGAEPTFFQMTSPLAALAVPFSALAELEVEDVGFVAIDVPTVKQAYDGVVVPLAGSAGMKTSLITYDPAAVDFTSVVSTLKANGTEAAIFSGSEEQCSSFAKAATTLDYQGTVVMGTCTEFIDELGDDAAGLLTLGFLYPPEAADDAPANIQKDLEQYEDDVTGDGSDVYSLYGYASVIDVARVLETIDGEISPATVGTAFAGLRDFASFAGNTLTCADRPAAQGSACDTSLLVFRVLEDGTLETVGDGFTAPPSA
ncbi:ABC transporter substrate-binding protein [Aeromicrobium endophyticum]|nr:ABC transporter substrate-binding protein [Aeromicrobium endophyticum]